MFFDYHSRAFAQLMSAFHPLRTQAITPAASQNRSRAAASTVAPRTLPSCEARKPASICLSVRILIGASDKRWTWYANLVLPP